MENEANMRSINSHQFEELQPRKVPKALCFNKVTPVPSVPDVSLVFDNNSKNPIQNCSPLLSRVAATSHTYQENYERDENEPRTIKPTPIAPLPNESYAAWRARAMNSQSEETGAISRSSFSTGSKLGLNGSTGNLLIGRKMKEPRNKSIVHENDSQQNYHSVAPGVALGHFASHIPNSQSSLEKTALSIRTFSCREQSGERYENTPPQCAQDRHRHSLPEAMMVGKSVEQSSSPWNKRQTITRYATPRDLENCSSDGPILSPDRQINNSVNPSHLRQTDNVYTQKSGASNSEGCAASCESSRDDNVNNKRDSFRDIYRIVQLQNEQIKSLQSQVERLLKKNISDSQKKNESSKAKKKSDSTQCVEEGTQTYDLEENMVSVGVMTSFIDLSKDPCSPENNKRNNSTTHCSGCKGGSLQEKNINDEYSSREEKIQEVFQNSGKYPNFHASPLNCQHDSPKTMSSMHRIIEENESDVSIGSRGGGAREVDLGTRDSGNQNNRVSNSRSKSPTNNQKAIRQGSSSEKCTARKLVNPSQVNKNEEIAAKSPIVLGDETYHAKRGNHIRPESQPHGLWNSKCCSRRNDEEMTMTLNGVDLQTVTDPHISPEPSIHVEIQDYREFSEEEQNSSNDEGSYSSGNESMSSSEHRGPLEIVEDPQNEARFGKNNSKTKEGVNGNAKVSWTFYDNVLGQVNKLLENQKGESHPRNVQEMESQNAIRNPNQPAKFESTPSDPISGGSETKFPDRITPTLEAVREATLQHLRQLGINFPCGDKYSAQVPVMPSHNRYDTPEAHFANRKNVAYDQCGPAGKTPRERRPTETSLKMNALALKYLNDEQLADLRHLELQREHRQPDPVKFAEQQAPTMAQEVIGEVSSTDFTLYGMNGTNLSFTTLRYLQRYQLIPCARTPVGIWRHQGEQQGNFTETANARGVDLRNRIKPSATHLNGAMQGENAGWRPHGRGTTPYLNAPMKPSANRMDGAMQGENGGGSPHGRGTTPYLNAPTKPSSNCMDGTMQGGNGGGNPHGQVNAPSQRGREVFSSEGLLTRRGSKRQDLQYAGNNENGGVHRGRIPDRGDNGMSNQIRKTKSKPSVDQVKSQEKHECGFGQSINLQRREERSRPKECGGNRDIKQKTQSSNILDITALRQQPKLL